MASGPGGGPDWLCALPRSWTYGVTRGGRVFFINEECQSTSWLHPVTGQALLTGHRRPTPDLPTGWEEAYTFEGARYYINHNDRKVSCRHPISGQPSQDNCIFVVSEQSAPTMTSDEKKERPVGLLGEASSYDPSSDYAAHPVGPVARSSRSSKKVHNFGKRSNSIKRNPNAPVVRRGWLYKQDSTGMKLWKKRWFVLSDLCLFYYRDEKEEGVLGSILLPSFQIAMLSAEDHIHRRYAFKAAHPNMRTYYFCTDSGKETELWMSAMLDAALVQTEPVKRADKVTAEDAPSREVNGVSDRRAPTRPESHGNQKTREVSKTEERKALEAEKFGFQKDGRERPLTKINSVRLNSLEPEQEGGRAGPGNPAGGARPAGGPPPGDPARLVRRTDSVLRLEQWIGAQKGKGHEEEVRGLASYQTLPRNMPSHRSQAAARYPEGYRTLPRDGRPRPQSTCGGPGPGRLRPGHGDTMWQLYEWQRRRALSRPGGCGGGPPPRSVPASPARGLPAAPPAFPAFPPPSSSSSSFSPPPRGYRPQGVSPAQRGDATLDRRLRLHNPKHGFVPERRSMPAGLTLQPISPRTLQTKTPEELTLLLIQLRRQQAELSSLREHTLTQLVKLKLRAHSPKLSQDECRGSLHNFGPEEGDIDAKLSRLCEQDRAVQALEERLEQLHTEKYTLEQALLSASQEIEMNAASAGPNAGPAALQTVVLQREDLRNGLLGTCRELARATAELERAWREYDKLDLGVTVTRTQMQDQLQRLGELQTDLAGIQRAQIQKELWRIQDVMEGLSKHKQQRSAADAGLPEAAASSATKSKNEEEGPAPPRPPLPRAYEFPERRHVAPSVPWPSGSLLCYSGGPDPLPEDRKAHPVPGHPRGGAHCGPDYRLYKSEPELTTVAEVDESNGEEKAEPASDVIDSSVAKGRHFPIGVVPPRTKSPIPESSTIASYVTLRKNQLPGTRRTERPRSSSEQPSVWEGVRPRMTVEEQMERIQRHQQACLRDRRKGPGPTGPAGLSGPAGGGPLESAPGPAWAADTLPRLHQNRWRGFDSGAADTGRRDGVAGESERKPDGPGPAEEEAARPREAWAPERRPGDFRKELVRATGPSPRDPLTSPEPPGADPEEIGEKMRGAHRPSGSGPAPPGDAEPADAPEDPPTPPACQPGPQHVPAGIADAAAQGPRQWPEPPVSPQPLPQPQLSEGSHFMCV
ncbi:pleckstrin homology domain-containing family A member 5 isoform X4 [Ornithorhynchus anatinus]|uniref:pleckstrin homology domain-containing family A member 5 isoform X4 n=1 Tax=Ornithorhynchus anatinus TaxID=9258 RepID=UPI0019D4EA4A|nr:pleckstrin homology domain-containing family A member 5 isoform X4 [Ornithorhynchus anatinus]